MLETIMRSTDDPNPMSGWWLRSLGEELPIRPGQSNREPLEFSSAVSGESWGAGQEALRDLEEAGRVSASMFPRALPAIANLAYAGVCVEARQAGGDYYDFFDYGGQGLGLAVGDVSGKGIAPALVRATLQAILRTLCSTGRRDLRESLTLANRLLLESTPERMYVTLFLAAYDANTRRLQYVNCGHPAPILFGRGGFSRLPANATILGFFNDWECTTSEVQLSPGDTLLVYTDGASEACNEDGQEFGEERLRLLLESSSSLPLSAMLRRGLAEWRAFDKNRERDDLTLVALRCLDFPQ